METFSKITFSCIVFGEILSGCITYRDFDKELDQYVGLSVTQVNYPRAYNSKLSKIDEKNSTAEYTFGGNCRWVFVTDNNTDVILSWHYSDENAAERCHGLALTAH